MIYGSRQGSEWDFHEIKSDVFKVCVFHAAACVTSFPDYSNLGDKDYEGVFANYDLNQTRYAQIVEEGGVCNPNNLHRPYDLASSQSTVESKG